MSGGSMQYLYAKIQEVKFDLGTPERVAFRDLLDKIAEALHDIEWVDSGDYRDGEENKAISACLTPGALLEAAVATAVQARDQLTRIIEAAASARNQEPHHHV